jgi:hypothetical protein
VDGFLLFSLACIPEYQAGLASGLGEAISAVVLVMVSSKEQLQGFMESSHFSTS